MVGRGGWGHAIITGIPTRAFGSVSVFAAAWFRVGIHD
jgi:hypothetical protein